MERVAQNDLYRCDLCHGIVDTDTSERARQAWQPLIVCERCVRDADERASRPLTVEAAA